VEDELSHTVKSMKVCLAVRSRSGYKVGEGVREGGKWPFQSRYEEGGVGEMDGDGRPRAWAGKVRKKAVFRNGSTGSR